MKKLNPVITPVAFSVTGLASDESINSCSQEKRGVTRLSQRSPQLVREKRGRSRLSPQPKLPLLTLLESPQSPEKRGVTRLLQPSWGKPQIQSCPGVPMKQRDRYRVVLAGEILGDRLTIDEALKLAKGGEL